MRFSLFAKSPEELTEALFLAAAKGNIDEVCDLVEAGANPNSCNSDFTPLQLAVLYKRAELACALVKLRADPNAPNRIGNTPLFLTCPRNNVEMARLLVRLGADPNKVVNFSATPLSAAAYWGYERMVRALLELRADPAIPDDSGLTPAQKASQGNITNIVAIVAMLQNPEQVRAEDVVPVPLYQPKTLKKCCAEFIYLPPHNRGGFFISPPATSDVTTDQVTQDEADDTEFIYLPPHNRGGFFISPPATSDVTTDQVTQDEADDEVSQQDHSAFFAYPGVASHKIGMK
jgi:ankyrin repeat protein